SESYVILGSRSQEELPEYFAALRIESEHASLATLEVPARIADEHFAVPCDRRRRHRLAELRIGDSRLPEPLAGFEVISQDTSVLGATKQHAVQVRGAPVSGQKRGGIILVRTPIYGTGCGIQRENIVHGGTDQRALHHEQASLKRGESPEVVCTENFQPGNIRRVDLVKRRVPI